MGKYEALAAIQEALERMELEERKELVNLINKKTELEELITETNARLNQLTGRAMDRFKVEAVKTTVRPQADRESCIYLDYQYLQSIRLPVQHQVLYINYMPGSNPPEIRCWVVDEED